MATKRARNGPRISIQPFRKLTFWAHATETQAYAAMANDKGMASHALGLDGDMNTNQDKSAVAKANTPAARRGDIPSFSS